MGFSLLEHIGNTPLVELARMNPNPNVRVLAKLEYLNPGGSIKDRAALFMIEAGEKSGELTPLKTVIEATSGNTGIGLAMVCAVKGYRLLLAMSENVSLERQKILRGRGAELLMTPGHLGTDGAIEEVYRRVRENPDAYFMTDQFNNPANCMAHYHGTAPEIWEQTGGAVTAVVATLGTTGTVMGLSARLKEFNRAVRIIAVEPYMGHRIQGLKNLKESYCPEIFDKRHLDEKVHVDDEEAFETARQLALKEGLFVGMSSGAAAAVAIRQAAAMDSGTVVAILPDSGERYLSTSLFTVPEKADISLFNTLGRVQEPLETLQPGMVSIYISGPTAYAPMGLNECRRFVFADLLRRYLELRDYSVRQVVNVTDLDDNTIAGSEAAGESLDVFTERHIRTFKSDIDTLGIQPAEAYPLTREHLDDMIRLAERLAQKGYAYEKLRSLYFDISRFDNYGQLSGVDLEKIRLGHTVDLDDYAKDNPRDFTLLKRVRLSELKRGLFTPSPWGNVRPSWHIQSTAMAMACLGDSFDIHISSRDLIFPHNDNEIAIANSATGKPLSRFWLHCESIRGDGIPESLMDLMALGFSGRHVRFWLLSTHYRKPLVYSISRLENARSALKRLDDCVQSLSLVMGGRPYTDLDQLLYDLKSGFGLCMNDDVNISGAISVLFKCIRKVNGLISSGMIDAGGAGRVLDAFKRIDRTLNLFDFSSHQLTGEARDLIERRRKARSERNWVLADQLREELRSLGVFVKDAKL
ncbi:MAG: cysteine synthase [Desulfobacterales bacterium]|jgi:cysteinyl-tRNA synthetase